MHEAKEKGRAFVFHLGNICGPSPKHLQAEQLTDMAPVSQICVCRGKQIIQTDQRLDVIIRNILVAVHSPLRISSLKDGEKASGTPAPTPRAYFYFPTERVGCLCLPYLQPQDQSPSFCLSTSHIYPYIKLKCYAFIFLDRGEGREKERERNINVWLPLKRPLLGA